MRQQGFSLAEMMVVVAVAAVLLAVALPKLDSMTAGSKVRSVADSIYSGLVMARSEAIKRNAPMRFQLVTLVTNSSCTYAGKAYQKSVGSASWVVSQYTATGTRGAVDGVCRSRVYSPEDNEEPCRLSTPASGSATATGWFNYTAYTTASPPTATNCTEDSSISSGLRYMCRPYGNPATCAGEPFVAHQSVDDTATGVTVVGKIGSTTITAPSSFVVTFGPLGQLVYNLEETTATPANTGNRPASAEKYVAEVSATSGGTRRWNVQVESNGMIRICDPGITDTTNKLGCSS